MLQLQLQKAPLEEQKAMHATTESTKKGTNTNGSKFNSKNIANTMSSVNGTVMSGDVNASDYNN
jgi:hypothetical protein